MKKNNLLNKVAEFFTSPSSKKTSSKKITGFQLGKSLVILMFIFNCFSVSNAQSKPFSAYEKALDTIVKKYNTKHPSYKFLKLFVDNFKNAKKTDAENLTKIVTGIGFYLDYDNTDLDIYPAIFSHRNGKVDISGLRSPTTKKPSGEMKEYANIYLNNWKEIGQTKTFKWLITHVPAANSLLTEMTYEHKVNSYDDISFIRSDNDWMYAVSFGDYGIGMYAFKLSMADEEISGSAVIEKIKEEKDAEFRIFLEEYPFAHYSNSVDILVNHLRERSSLSKDQSFLRNTESIKKELDREKLANYAPMLNYLLEYKFPSEMLVDGNVNIDKYGLKHFSAHTLGDYYFSQKNYSNAIDLYKKSVLNFPPDNDDDEIRSDTNNALLSIAKAYHHQNKRNESYASFLGILFSENELTKVQSQILTQYLTDSKEDKKLFKVDLEKAIVSIKKMKGNYYSFNFRKSESFFYTERSVENKNDEIKKSNFYRSLN